MKHKRFVFDQHFGDKVYKATPGVCINPDGFLECPKCGDARDDVQKPEVEILQHSFLSGRTISTLMVWCSECGHCYAFQSEIEPSENIVVVGG